MFTTISYHPHFKAEKNNGLKRLADLPELSRQPVRCPAGGGPVFSWREGALGGLEFGWRVRGNCGPFSSAVSPGSCCYCREGPAALEGLSSKLKVQQTGNWGVLGREGQLR